MIIGNTRYYRIYNTLLESFLYFKQWMIFEVVRDYHGNAFKAMLVPSQISVRKWSSKCLSLFVITTRLTPRIANTFLSIGDTVNECTFIHLFLLNFFAVIQRRVFIKQIDTKS